MAVYGIILSVMVLLTAFGIAGEALVQNETTIEQTQQRTLEQLGANAQKIAIAALQNQASNGQPFSVPTSTPVPLCAPGVTPCDASATFAYSKAGGTTTPTAPGSNTETASNLLGVVSEGRVVLDATVQIVDTANPCTGSALASGNCAIPTRTFQIPIRLMAAYPYAVPDGGFSEVQLSQNTTTQGAPDYGGCNGSTGCGNSNPSGIATTPDSTILVSNPTCTVDPYGACPATTPPPANYHNVTFQNSNIP